MLKQLQSLLDILVITDLVEQNTEGGAVFYGLSAALSLDCGVVTIGINKLLTLRLTGKHGMCCVANQDESVLVPLWYRLSSY